MRLRLGCAARARPTLSARTETNCCRAAVGSPASGAAALRRPLASCSQAAARRGAKSSPERPIRRRATN